MTPIPPGLGEISQDPDEAWRFEHIAKQIRTMLGARVLTPAERVMILTSLATAIVARHVPDARDGLNFLARLTARCMAHAQEARRDEALRDAEPAGRA